LLAGLFEQDIATGNETIAPNSGERVPADQRDGLVVRAANFVALRSTNRLPSAASSTPKEKRWQKVLFPSPP
jgi:hypothetical protein